MIFPQGNLSDLQLFFYYYYYFIKKYSNKLIYDRCPVQVLGYHEPSVILKDNDLKHKIRLPGTTAKFLLKQLEKDTELLCSLGVMDYSLLGKQSSFYFFFLLNSYGNC